MKTKTVKRNSRTHFPQIPVEVVKKIEKAREKTTTDTNTENLLVEPPAKKTEPYSMPISSLCWTGH